MSLKIFVYFSALLNALLDIGADCYPSISMGGGTSADKFNFSLR